MESDFYYIIVKVIFPEDEKIQSYYHYHCNCSCISNRGWSGGAKVLGKLPVPGRTTNLGYSRPRTYCACSRCGRGLFGHFFLTCHFSFLSPTLWETARYRLKDCLKGPLSPKQSTNQPMHFEYILFWMDISSR